MLQIFVEWFTFSAIYGAVILLGAIGETFTEKVGNLNLGTPGIIAMGAAGAFIGSFIYESHVSNVFPVLAIMIPLLSAVIMSAFAGLMYSILTVTLRANQNVTGLTLTIFGVGVAKFFGAYVIPEGSVANSVPKINQYFVANIHTATGGALGSFGRIFLSYGFMLYLSILIAVLSSLFFNKTKIGLNLRAVGENPATADAVGINITKYKYLTILLGSCISGLGGAYYVLDYGKGIWSTATVESIEKLGWLSVALVIFATWKPINLIWGSFIFGLCFWAYQFIPNIIGVKFSTDLSQMLPYIVTIVVLLIVSLRNKKENQPPASLGLSYFREER